VLLFSVVQKKSRLKSGIFLFIKYYLMILLVAKSKTQMRKIL